MKGVYEGVAWMSSSVWLGPHRVDVTEFTKDDRMALHAQAAQEDGITVAA